MKNCTAYLIAQAIQLLHLDGRKNYTTVELAKTSGVSIATINRSKTIIDLLDTALLINRGGYYGR